MASLLQGRGVSENRRFAHNSTSRARRSDDHCREHRKFLLERTKVQNDITPTCDEVTYENCNSER